jgi:4-diphosphocytidyl-2C-methyl-D-erythritol kinase
VFEDVLGEKRRDFLRLRRQLLAAGARDAHLSGSGSAIFGIIPPRESPFAVAGRLSGSEPLYAVKSERAGMRLVVLP